MIQSNSQKITLPHFDTAYIFSQNQGFSWGRTRCFRG